METMPRPVILPTVRAKKVHGIMVPVNVHLTRESILKNGIWGCKNLLLQRSNSCAFTRRLRIRRVSTIQCSHSSFSNGSYGRAENFKENDEDYINSSVIAAVEVKNGLDGFMIKMRDGMILKCVHCTPQGGHLPDHTPHPAIVLKMGDGSDTLLPIIVLETPSVLLMAAIHNVHFARPTIYEVTKEMIEQMGYAVKLIRITKRVHEAYFAEMYLAKVDNEDECISLDLRPSDAINIAVRCKVPIQVNKSLAHSDGMVVLESVKISDSGYVSSGLLSTELDKPSSKPSIEAKEFNLLRNMLDAAGEERYHDAGTEVCTLCIAHRM